mgnify:CR=1 FL=1
MLKTLFGLLAAIALPSPLHAADMPAKAPIVSGLVAPSSGLYFGVNGAGAKLSSKFDQGVAGILAIPGTGDLHPSGAMAGLTFGAGVWNGNVYFGLEADADYDFSKNNVANCGVVGVGSAAAPVNCKVKSGFLFTERAILGVTLGGLTNAAVRRGATAPSNWPVPISGPTSIYAAQMMPFLTAGAAERRLEACIEPVGCNKQWLVGWTVGGGLRFPVSTNMSVTATYLYVGWNKHFNPAGPEVFPEIFKSTSEQLIKLNLDYHL